MEKEIPITPGLKRILETVKDELFPKLERLKEVLVRIQACRISFHLYSKELWGIERDYHVASKGFFEVVKKLETPDILFAGIDGGEANIVPYYQFQGAFKQNIAEGIVYVEIIDRTLDRKVGTIQNSRTFLISILAVVISIFAIFLSARDALLW